MPEGKGILQKQLGISILKYGTWQHITMPINFFNFMFWEWQKASIYKSISICFMTVHNCLLLKCYLSRRIIQSIVISTHMPYESYGIIFWYLLKMWQAQILRLRCKNQFYDDKDVCKSGLSKFSWKYFKFFAVLVQKIQNRSHQIHKMTCLQNKSCIFGIIFANIIFELEFLCQVHIMYFMIIYIS